MRAGRSDALRALVALGSPRDLGRLIETVVATAARSPEAALAATHIILNTASTSAPQHCHVITATASPLLVMLCGALSPHTSPSRTGHAIALDALRLLASMADLRLRSGELSIIISALDALFSSLATAVDQNQKQNQNQLQSRSQKVPAAGEPVADAADAAGQSHASARERVEADTIVVVRGCALLSLLLKRHPHAVCEQAPLLLRSARTVVHLVMAAGHFEQERYTQSGERGGGFDTRCARSAARLLEQVRRCDQSKSKRPRLFPRLFTAVPR